MNTSLDLLLSHHDSFLFHRCTIGHVLFSLYVDNITITCNDVDGIVALKTELARCLTTKDLSSFRHFLDIEVASSPRGYLLSKYIANIFESTRLTDNKTTDAPLELNTRYSPFDSSPFSNPNLYRTVVSILFISLSLIYILHMFIWLISLLPHVL